MAIVYDDQNQDSTEVLQPQSDVSTMPTSEDSAKFDVVDLGEIDGIGETGAVKSSVQPPVGMGPVADARQYSEMVRPGYETAVESTTPKAARILTAVDAAFPFAAGDELYSAIRASVDPNLDYGDWSKIVYDAEKKLPYGEQIAATVVGTAAGLALPWGALKLAGDANKVARIGAWFNTLGPKAKLAAYGVVSGASGVGNVQDAVISKGASKDSIIEAGLNASVPGLIKSVALGAGKASSGIWKMFVNDVDTKAAIKALDENPFRYDDLASAQEERGAAITIFGDVVEKINAAYDAGTIKVGEFAKKIADAKNEWVGIDDFFKRAAARAGNLSDDETSSVYMAYKDLNKKIIGLEKEAIAKLPASAVYASDPAKYGFQMSSVQNQYEKIISKLSHSSSEIDKGLIPQFRNQMDGFYEASARDAIRNGATPESVSYLLQNRHLITDPGARFILNGRNVAANKMMDVAGTNADDVKRTVSFMGNVSPERVHEMKNSLFQRGSGYVSQRDMTAETKRSQELFSSWHRDIRGEMGSKYEGFEDATKIPENMKQEVLFPIEERLQIKKTNMDNVRSGFQTMAKEVNRQGTDAITRWSMETGIDLIGAARRIKHLNEYGIHKGDLTMSSVMDHLADRRKLGQETLQAIGMMPPDVRAKFGELERSAMRAVDVESDLNKLTEKLISDKDKYGTVIGMKVLRGEGTNKTVQSLVESVTNKRVNPSSKTLFDVTPDVRDLFDIERFGREGGSTQINKMVDRLKRVRENELLGKSIGMLGAGSSAANIGQAIGQSAKGNLGAAIGAVGFGVANSLGGMSARRVVGALLRKGMDMRANSIYSDIISSNIAREVASPGIEYLAGPGTQEAADLIVAIRNDYSMKPSDKLKAIKDIRDNGLEIRIPTNGEDL